MKLSPREAKEMARSYYHKAIMDAAMSGQTKLTFDIAFEPFAKEISQQGFDVVLVSEPRDDDPDFKKYKAGKKKFEPIYEVKW